MVVFRVPGQRVDGLPAIDDSGAMGTVLCPDLDLSVLTASSEGSAVV